METEKLYYADAFQTECTARVVSCEEGKKGYEVVLDRTVFYPEGGGQPGDTGYLNDVRVTDTHEKAGLVVHYCASALAPGSEVAAKIDWDRRFDLMQQHSGEHIFSGLVHEKYGYNNVGFHLGADTVTIDFDGEIDEAGLREIELKANEAVWRDDPVEIFYPSPDALAALSRFWTEAPRLADGKAVSQHDEQFHQALVAAAGNGEMARIHRELTEKIRIIRRLDFTQQARVDATYREHAAILQAILQRQSGAAQTLLGEHIAVSKAEVRKITLHMLHQARAQQPARSA